MCVLKRTDVIKLRVVKWDDPGLSEWPNIITRVLIRERHRVKDRKGNVRTDPVTEGDGGECLGIRRGSREPRKQATSRNLKVPYSLQMEPVMLTPWLEASEAALGLLTSQSDERIHLCCVKPLSMWHCYSSNRRLIYALEDRQTGSES